MGEAEIGYQTAWITAAVLGAQALIGRFGVRAMPRSANSVRSTRPRMLAGHMVIGIALAPLAFAHAWFSMKTPHVRETSAAGLWVATFALLLVIAQALIGMSMLRLGESQGTGFRRLHLAMAIMLITLAGVHMALNR